MEPQRISPQELKRSMDDGEAVAVLDTRSSKAWDTSDVQLPSAMRVPPDEIRDHLADIPRDRLIVAYCT